MKLYRGDKIFNKATSPSTYRSDGLRTKAFGSGGLSTNIEKIGLGNTIKYHVHHKTKLSLQYYEITDYLSFSASRKRALYWCSDRNTLVLQKATNFEETRYLFVLDIDRDKLIDFGKGINLFEFCCNLQLKESNSRKEPEYSFMKAASKTFVCPTCNNSELNHKILLINSFKYLSSFPNHAISPEALTYAEQDEEWLLLPLDVDRNQQRLTRLQRADFWTAEHFNAVGENRPKTGKLFM